MGKVWAEAGGADGRTGSGTGASATSPVSNSSRSNLARRGPGGRVTDGSDDVVSRGTGAPASAESSGPPLSSTASRARPLSVRTSPGRSAADVAGPGCRGSVSSCRSTSCAGATTSSSPPSFVPGREPESSALSRDEPSSGTPAAIRSVESVSASTTGGVSSAPTTAGATAAWADAPPDAVSRGTSRSPGHPKEGLTWTERGQPRPAAMRDGTARLRLILLLFAATRSTLCEGHDAHDAARWTRSRWLAESDRIVECDGRAAPIEWPPTELQGRRRSRTPFAPMICDPTVVTPHAYRLGR